MNGKILFLAGLIASCASASYGADCKIRHSDLDGFAKYRLGHLRALPKGVRTFPHCAIYRKYHTFDCEFVDADGTHYTAANNEIAKLERGPETSATLPATYPLKFGMPVKDAVRAISAMDAKIELTTRHGTDSTVAMDTGECLKDSHGITYYFAAGFDKAGRLNRLSAGFETAGD